MAFQRIFDSAAFARAAARVVVCCATLGIGAHAFALGLGEANISSALGQPLQMTVPVTMDPGTQLSPDCVRIVPGSETGDAVASLNTARVTIDAEHSQLRIESPQPVTEPALRVVVEVGCTQHVRREFALLLDPPGMAAPTPNAGVAGLTPGAPALGLGMAQISAVLGQRLSIKVPVVGPDAGSLTADCVHLTDPISSEGAPVLREAAIRVSPVDTGALIEVTTAGPVTEPAVRLALDVGCHDPLRREYAILLGLPTLAVSNAEPMATVPEAKAGAQEAPPPEPVAKPAPKRVPKRPRVVTAVPVAPRPEARAPSMSPVETPATAAPKAVAPGSDRLVLGSPPESVPTAPHAADSQAAEAANAELLKRMDAMSRQIEALEAQLAAERLREHDLERRASESREGWAWLMGGLGGLLLGGALVMAWRQQARPKRSTWDSVDRASAQVGASRPAAPQAPRPAEVSEIGGRAAMAPSPTTISPTSEQSFGDGKHSEITVTELHDTVQVIKELYATVLERTTSNAAGEATGGRASKPLDLDLRTPTAGPATGSPRLLADQDRSGGSGPAKSGEPKRGLEGHFTEMPTEVGLDLDLTSVIAPGASVDTDALADVLGLQRPNATPSPAGTAPAREPTAADPPVPTQSEAASAPAPGRPEASTRSAHSDDQLTQTPTEVLIDIDVGETTDFATVDRSATRFNPAQRAGPERSKGPPSPLDPIDLQLDLPPSEAKPPRRGGKGTT